MCVCSHHRPPFWATVGPQGRRRGQCSESLHTGHPLPTACYSASGPWGQLMVEIKNVLNSISLLPQGARWVCPTFPSDPHGMWAWGSASAG